MTPELESLVNQIISAEHGMNLIEQTHMAVDQMEGYQGAKRMHRYNSRWRNEAAIRLANHVIDNYDIMPRATVQFTTPTAPVSYEAGVRAMISSYESLRLMYKDLSRMSLTENLDELMQLAESQLCWVACVKRKYKRELKETMGKSTEFLQMRSMEIHKKYKEKEKEFRVDTY